jgi:hypothetical protein
MIIIMMILFAIATILGTIDMIKQTNKDDSE